MANVKRSWTSEDVARLRELAGKRTAQQIAKELGRTKGAVEVEASKLKISLSTGRRVGRLRDQTEARGDMTS